MKTSFCIITTTIDCKEIADKIIHTLLDKKLAACIQTHRVKSHYRWKNKIESADETLLQIKTKTSLFDEIKKEIKLLHTYETPEIILTEILAANNSYLDWLREETL